MIEVTIEIINEADEVTIDVIGGSAGTGSSLLPAIEFIPDEGLNTFDVPELEGATVIAAARAGTVQKITTTTPTKSREMQIDGITITLMPGDLTGEDELFTYIVVK